ncbi:MAG: hypothetical protein K2L12_02825 [Clostridia bacterium]|nr:hypothetical protein [Clostridia bacterium]
MENVSEILEIEEKYKKLLMAKLGTDERLALSCPDFKYPEPLFVYVKCVKTGKTIAVRLDGVDKTMRFWDYVDDDYSEEDGVWDKMTEKGLDSFIKKLYTVMDHAFDIEFFDENGDCNDFYSGVFNLDPTVDSAKRAIKKYGKDIDYVFAGFISFFGDAQYMFDSKFNLIKAK